MNEAQGLTRLKNILRSLRWGSTGDQVFGPGSVKVTAAPQGDAIDRLILPAAFIRPGAGLRDPQSGQGNIYRHAIGVTLVCALPGDEFGEAAFLGGFRSGGSTSGDSRGLLELQGLVLPAIQQLGPKDGWLVSHVASSMPEAALDEGKGYVVARQYQLEAWLDSQPRMPTPHDFTGSVAGSDVSLAWTSPDSTTDLVKYVLRRTSGSVPVARPTEGTAVTLAANLSTSKTDQPGAGTWTYSLFAMYAEPGGSVGLYYTDFLDVTVTV